MIGDISNFDNLNFLVPKPYHPPMAPLYKAIIFIDSKIYSGQLTNHLLSRFPEEQQMFRPVRHLHSDMSKAHISDAYLSFKDPNGMCRILVATASAANVSECGIYFMHTHPYDAQGIDVTGIQRVILFGIPKNPMDHEQKGGRGGRSVDEECLVLLIAESWAFANAAVAKEGYEHNAKVQRTEKVMFDYTASAECRRSFFANFNDDRTDDGIVIQF